MLKSPMMIRFDRMELRRLDRTEEREGMVKASMRNSRELGGRETREGESEDLTSMATPPP